MAREVVASPMPGIRKSIDVAVGGKVNWGDTLCILARKQLYKVYTAGAIESYDKYPFGEIVSSFKLL